MPIRLYHIAQILMQNRTPAHRRWLFPMTVKW
jgi:hypothetical protein